MVIAELQPVFADMPGEGNGKDPVGGYQISSDGCEGESAKDRCFYADHQSIVEATAGDQVKWQRSGECHLAFDRVSEFAGAIRVIDQSYTRHGRTRCRDYPRHVFLWRQESCLTLTSK